MSLSSATARMYIFPADPTVNDDSSLLYEVGNWWLNSVSNDLFQCLDASVGAAIWDFKPSQSTDVFTPVLEFGGASTGITYDTQAGNWVLTKNQISFNVFLDLSNKGSATGNARITGLPEVNGSVPAAFLFYQQNIGLPVSYASFGARIAPLSSDIILFAQAPLLSLQNLTDAEFANNSQLFISGTYFV